jgi:hypothetical protein
VLTALLRSFYFQACTPAGKSIQSCSLKAALIGPNRVNIPQERFGSSPADQFSSSSRRIASDSAPPSYLLAS